MNLTLQGTWGSVTQVDVLIAEGDPIDTAPGGTYAIGYSFTPTDTTFAIQLLRGNLSTYRLAVTPTGTTTTTDLELIIA